MSLTLRFRRRSVGGASGAPASLKTAEPAYNMQDGRLYIGFGDDGSGNATSIKPFASDDFVTNIPTGGTSGQVLAKASNTAGDIEWVDVAEGAFYTASGDGIELSSNQFSLNYSEIDTGLTLTSRLAGKSDTGHTHAASDVTSGAFAVARIPDLSANKITSDTLGVARIPDLDAAKIATGVLATGRIPDLDAAKITSGVLDVARIPVLPANKTIVSSGGIANLTAGQQTDIVEGTIVTTTDGRRWVYSGSGSKTAEGSYVELADVSPEWSTIANKPAFATVATSGSYDDLTNLPVLATVATSGSYNDLLNLPTLGTIAAQNANNVAITGGSIAGVNLDGGTF